MPYLVPLLLLLVPVATAHEAPPPTGGFTRLLHDHNDDCGGDGVVANCRGTHDLIALDVREAWDPRLGNVLVFRFWLDEGSGGTLQDTLSFTAEGQRHTFTLKESSGRMSGDFDRVGGKKGINDGTRFTVDATLAYDTLGVQVGDVLDAYTVEATSDGTRGDYMPGGYHGAAGTVEDPPQGNQPKNFELRSYRMEGPTAYATLDMRPEEATLEPDKEVLVTLSVRNRIQEPQQFDFTLEAQPGVEAAFHRPDAGTGGYSPTYELDLRAGGEGALHLSLTGTDPGASGTVTVTMTSDKGARLQQVFPFGVGTAPPAATQTSAPPTVDEDAAGPVLAPIGALILTAVLVRRR